MTKKELVEIVADKMGTTYPETEETLNAFLEVIMETMANGEKVKIIGFGSFESFLAKERKGHNPYSNEPITIPTHRNVRFRAGKHLKGYIDTENYRSHYEELNY